MMPPSSPTLKWLSKDSQILASDYGVRGKTPVFLEGTRYPYEAELPYQFEVLKAHSLIVRKFRTNVLHRPVFSPFDHVDVYPNPSRPGEVRSGPYKLPPKKPLVPPVRLLFQDGTNNLSPVIHVEGRVGIKRVKTGGFEFGPMGIEFPTVDLFAPSEDPSVSLSVLAPWIWEPDAYGLTFTGYIHNIAEDQASDTNVDDQPPLEADVAAVYEALVSYLKDYLPSDSLGWHIAFEPSELVIEPGSSGTAVLRVDAETPGQAVFAVVATPDGNPEEAAVSDLYVLEVLSPDVFEIRDSLHSFEAYL